VRTDGGQRHFRARADPVLRHLAKGWTAKAVHRALKRAVAREIYRALAGRCEVPDYSDLRAARRPRTSPSLPSRPNSGSGPPASDNSNSADAETTNSPTATEPGSTPLDNAQEHQTLMRAGIGGVTQMVVSQDPAFGNTGDPPR
jgi:hypothetical protein